MSDKLSALGYRQLVEADHYAPKTLANLSSIIGRPVPAPFTRFLEEFPNSGIFEQSVDVLGLEAAPGVPDKRYPISGMYANCSKSHLDIVKRHEGRLGIWSDFLIFGNDSIGNLFAIDLRDSEFGKIKCKTSEEDWDGRLYLVASDFESFILSLQSSD